MTYINAVRRRPLSARHGAARRRLAWAVPPVALLAVAGYFWVMAGGDARYAIRVLARADSSITDLHWKNRTTIRPAATPRPWAAAPGCAVREALPTQAAQALLVVHDGRIVCEWYGNGGARDRPAMAFSISKTVLSLLLARAVADGAVQGLDTPVTDGIPELRGKDGRFTAITLADLLDMRSGIAFSERVAFPWVNQDYPAVYYARDLAGTVVRRARIAGPPGGFQYNDYAPNLIGLAVQRSAGIDLTRAPLQRLWTDMGAEHPAGWCVDDKGFPYYESGFLVTARDLARIGQLTLDGGSLDGRPVAPRAFADRSLPSTGPEPAATLAGIQVGYRNGWWLLPRAGGAHDLAAMGAHGQIMLVSPSTRTVVIRMGDDHPTMTNVELAATLQRFAGETRV